MAVVVHRVFFLSCSIHQPHLIITVLVCVCMFYCTPLTTEKKDAKVKANLGAISRGPLCCRRRCFVASSAASLSFAQSVRRDKMFFWREVC